MSSHLDSEGYCGGIFRISEEKTTDCVCAICLRDKINIFSFLLYITQTFTTKVSSTYSVFMDYGLKTSDEWIP